jgi:glycosyltransferase involved in cell wall biosynthesis
VDALAEGIEGLIRDRERLRAMGAAARRRAEEHDWAHYAARFERLLARVSGASLARPQRMR